MNFAPKFRDLCTRRAMYFSRADKFKDSLEGTISKRNLFGKSASDLAFDKCVMKRQTTFEEAAQQQRIAKMCSFVNCWNMSDHESIEMWNEYTDSPHSVVIRTTVGRLRVAFGNRVFMSPVRYIDENTPRTEFDARSLFFFKDVQYAKEREFRLFTDLLEFGGSIRENDPLDFFRYAPVKLETLLLEVRLHPQAKAFTEDAVVALLGGCHPGVRIRYSELLFR